jgi:hypothetical protein
MLSALRTAAVIGTLAASGPACAGQPFGFEPALAVRNFALIREAAIGQVSLWRLMAAAERLNRSGYCCLGIPGC